MHSSDSVNDSERRAGRVRPMDLRTATYVMRPDRPMAACHTERRRHLVAARALPTLQLLTAGRSVTPIELYTVHAVLVTCVHNDPQKEVHCPIWSSFCLGIGHTVYCTPPRIVGGFQLPMILLVIRKGAHYSLADSERHHFSKRIATARIKNDLERK